MLCTIIYLLGIDLSIYDNNLARIHAKTIILCFGFEVDFFPSFRAAHKRVARPRRLCGTDVTSRLTGSVSVSVSAERHLTGET